MEPIISFYRYSLKDISALDEKIQRLTKENNQLQENQAFLTARLLDRADTLFKLGVELADTKRELEKYKNAVL